MKKVSESTLIVILAVILVVISVFIAFNSIIKSNNESTVPQTFYTARLPEKTETATTEATTSHPDVDAKEQIATINHNFQVTQPTETEEPTETTEATEPTTSPYATMATQKSKASYQKQWDAGYLIALDYPDANYKCPHVELSEENRVLIEKICLAEFGTGGFNGAALIAQSIKNAMVYYGTDDVEAIIGKLKYSGRKSSNTSKTVRDAITYVFDMDLDAVQHRILYKYNPDVNGGPSKFHESKEYVCTYNNVRFFDE